MLYENVYIDALGYDLPETAVSSLEIEDRLSPCYQRLGFHAGRIQLMSGIKDRRHYPVGERPSSIATRAAQQALEQSNVALDQIGVLIHSSVCRDFMEPATATVVHQALGLPDSCMAFDLSNACLGFCNAMLVAANMIELGQIDAALVVAGEDGGPLVNATIDRLNRDESIGRKESKLSFASLTIGSGGAAMVLTRKGVTATGHRLLGARMLADTAANELCQGGRAGDSNLGPLMQTDSETLMQQGVTLAARVWGETRDELGWSSDDYSRVFTHQVGVAHRKLLFEKLEIDASKDFPTVETLGNIGSVSLPISLAMGVEQGRFQSGENAALLGIGSGLVCLNMGIRW